MKTLLAAAVAALVVVVGPAQAAGPGPTYRVVVTLCDGGTAGYVFAYEKAAVKLFTRRVKQQPAARIFTVRLSTPRSSVESLRRCTP